MVTPWNAIRAGLTSSSRFVLGRVFDFHTWHATEAVRHMAHLLHPGQGYGTGRGSISLNHVGPLTSEQPYTDNIRMSGALPLSSDMRRPGSSPISLHPRYLCFVKDFDEGIYETVKVSDYLEQHGDDTDLEFVFVSYTRMQFRVATEEEINKHKYPDETTREANR
ncbi:3-hydroxyisobutyrate dehydrogenase protein [Colletotrichum incanum]|uniref:3-hydroxyisobutyrate dehydrogenase protein n=1 Tax=Colletotrichum incanum TaxID=1573173 RepID=A0A167DZA1_COLIC|nr:3-hydroxyisobutyrate dehydrogenase protein [Colletotrichum incanum]